MEETQFFESLFIDGESTELNNPCILSPIDTKFLPISTNHFAWIYRGKLEGEIFKIALRKTLTTFYTVGSRLQYENEVGTGRLLLKPGSGIKLSFGTCSLPISTFTATPSPSRIPQNIQKLSNYLFPTNSSNYDGRSIIKNQLPLAELSIVYIENYSILSLRWHHILGDGISESFFMHRLSMEYRITSGIQIYDDEKELIEKDELAKSILQKTSLHDILKPHGTLSEEQVTDGIHPFKSLPNGFRSLLSGTTTSQSRKVVTKMFYFTQHRITQLKTLLSYDGSSISSASALSGYVWSLLANLPLRNHSKPSKLWYAVNLRPRLTPKLPDRILGNIISHVFPTTHPSTPTHHAKTIQSSLTTTNHDVYISKAYHAYAKWKNDMFFNSDYFSDTPDILISSVVGMKLDYEFGGDVEFMEFVFPATFGVPNWLNFVSGRDIPGPEGERSGVWVYVSLVEEEMNVFESRLEL
ncbi:hypothetical protein HK098_004048 [Nowakowskiella sp. JEL0407]|nr:hypothetical protein HK098_004048 [Nowakowskiella sp. JEL0407]